MNTNGNDDSNNDIFINIHDEKEGLFGRLVGEAFGHGKPFNLVHTGENGALFEADGLELVIILHQSYGEPEFDLGRSEPYLSGIIKIGDLRAHVNAESYSDLLKVIASTVSRIK